MKRLLVFLLPAAPLRAGESYDSFTAGSQTGGNIAMDAATGEPFAFPALTTGTSTVRPGQSATHIVPVSFATEPASLPEDSFANNAISVRVNMDDGTHAVFAEVPASSPPLVQFFTGGSYETGAVIEDTVVPLTMPWFWGRVLTGSITINNANPDNFGLYAADGIPDLWQKSFFGLENPLGIASADPDGDNQNNRFEFLSGYSPADGAAFLRLSVTGKSPTEANLALSRVLSTTRYIIEESTTLGAAPDPWSDAATLEPATTQDDFPFSLPSPVPENFFRVHLEAK